MVSFQEPEDFLISALFDILRPSVREGWPIGHIYPIFTFDESTLGKTVDFYEQNINLSQGQIELLKFIKNVHRIHRNEFDYRAFLDNIRYSGGPLFLFIFMDDYKLQTNWKYMVLTPENLANADLRDDDRERIEAEMELSPDDRFKVNYLFTEKSDLYPEQKFLLEIWQAIPTDENLSMIEEVQDEFATIFKSLHNKSFNIYSHSALVVKLLNSYRGDILRTSFERWSIKNKLEPVHLVYNDFLGRVGELIMNSNVPEVKEAWRGEEKGAIIMMFRMVDTEAAKHLRETYGPIVRLTEQDILIYLNDLKKEQTSIENEEQDSWLDHEIRLYQRNLELIKQMEEGSLNLLFLHEGWSIEYNVPFVCMFENV